MFASHLTASIFGRFGGSLAYVSNFISMPQLSSQVGAALGNAAMTVCIAVPPAAWSSEPAMHSHGPQHSRRSHPTVLSVS